MFAVLRLRRLLVVLVPVLMAFGPSVARAHLQLGLQAPALESAAPAGQSSAAYRVLHRVGGAVVRIDAYWSTIEPSAPVAGSRAQDPANPAFAWDALDTAVRRASAHGTQVLLLLFSAPGWAQGPNPLSQLEGIGTWNPDPALFHSFARAVAERYSGHYVDLRHAGRALPRVRDFEVWNEENLPIYFQAPQTVTDYRALLTAGYTAIKAVHRDNLVAIGGLAPVSYLPPLSVSPLTFAADLMCLRRVGTAFVALAHCRSAPFDVLAEHPYTLAVTPTQPASRYDDVLVADMHKLRSLLDTARRLRTIGAGPHPLWVTEWSWLTDPPDHSNGDSFTAAARYVAYSMYEMWKAGASLVIWQEIRDSTPTELLGGGLETRAGRPKPSMRAFAFPFIAAVRGGRGYAWGRVPTGRPAEVSVQRGTSHGWQTVARAPAGQDGVFAASFTGSRNATYRALAPELGASLPYDSAPIPAQATQRPN